MLEGFAQYHSRNEAGGTEGGRNYGRFSDQGVDDLLQQAIRTLDLDERKIVLREFQDLVLELMPIAGLGTSWTSDLFRPEIGGIDNWGSRLVLRNWAHEIWRNDV